MKKIVLFILLVIIGIFVVLWGYPRMKFSSELPSFDAPLDLSMNSLYIRISTLLWEEVELRGSDGVVVSVKRPRGWTEGRTPIPVEDGFMIYKGGGRRQIFVGLESNQVACRKNLSEWSELALGDSDSGTFVLNGVEGDILFSSQSFGSYGSQRQLHVCVTGNKATYAARLVEQSGTAREFRDFPTFARILNTLEL